LGLISGYIFGQYILPGRGLTKFYMALISCTNSTAFQLLLIQTFYKNFIDFKNTFTYKH